MAENKTKATTASVSGYIAAIKDDARRKDCKALSALMKKATGITPKMWGNAIVGFGSYHYKYDSGREGDMCLVGFSSRSNAIVLYAGDFDGKPAAMAKLGKYKQMGGCMHIKTLSDVDVKTLAQIVKKAAIAKKATHRGA